MRPHQPRSRRGQRLTRPAEVEEQVDDIQCKYCGKSFKSEEKFMKHIGEVHPSEKNIFTCLFCAQNLSAGT